MVNPNNGNRRIYVRPLPHNRCPLVQDLLEILSIPIRVQTRLNIAPGAKGQIVYETNQGRTLEDAI